MARDPRDRTTTDMFDAAYPVRRATPIDGMSFEVKLCAAISQALKDCPDSREAVAARMAEYLGEPHFSKAMLDAYASPARDSHRITVKRFMALVHVTKANWLLDELARPFGCHVLESEDARAARIGLAEMKISELQKYVKTLKHGAPAHIKRSGR
jgi:hypothetical protein